MLTVLVAHYFAPFAQYCDLPRKFSGSLHLKVCSEHSMDMDCTKSCSIPALDGPLTLTHQFMSWVTQVPTQIMLQGRGRGGSGAGCLSAAKKQWRMLRSGVHGVLASGAWQCFQYKVHCLKSS